ncbi:MAG: hypothetical protein IPO93_00140 [Actinobacteria bacterium]|jgi:hypothetical protein|nr:hypothetical protein [Actinomycetota bacterium]
MSLPELAALHRPRCRATVPVLWRARSTVQIGDDVIVDRITPAHVTWLASLDGLRTSQQVSDELTIPVADARRLLRAMVAAGALDDAARLPDAMRWAPPTARESVARLFDTALSTYRDVDVALRAMDGRGRLAVGVLGRGPLRDAVAAAVEAAGLVEVADLRKAGIVVLADGHHPEVPAHFDHDVHDVPHVHVGVLAERAVVGPLVDPGRTSCLRCAHLHRRDADPAWPLLSVQWSQAVMAMASVPIDPLLARLAADVCALLVRSWADAPDQHDRWADLAYDLRLPDPMPRRVPRPPHPLCGCLWQAA